MRGNNFILVKMVKNGQNWPFWSFCSRQCTCLQWEAQVELPQFLKIREPLVKMGFRIHSLEWVMFLRLFFRGHSEAPGFWGFLSSFDFRGVTRKLFLGILEGKSFGITNSGQVCPFEMRKLRIVPIWRVFKLVIFH